MSRRRCRGALSSSASRPLRPPPVHLFEPTGFGGIFQHSCALAAVLGKAGYDVTLHTAGQHEPVATEGFELCQCAWWPRKERAYPGRRLLIAASLCVRTLRHLHRSAQRGAIVHVQGGVASGPLTALTLAVAGLRGRAVVYSPHNTFSRRGWADDLILRACLAVTDTAVGYSERDVATLREYRAYAVHAPLIQLVPRPSAEEVQSWRSEWGAGAGDQIVLFAGQIRADKRLDLLVRAAAGWPATRRLAVVGQDRGALRQCLELAQSLGVEPHVQDEFIDLDRFAAALAAADVVVAPYERASQSGVLSVAGQLGTATVASAVGGLGELAGETFPPGDSDALAAAIDAQLRRPSRPALEISDEAALEAHREAYLHAVAPREEASGPLVSVIVWSPATGRAQEFAQGLGGEWRSFFDLGILSRPLIPLRYALSGVRTVLYLLRTRPRSLIVANPPIVPALIGSLYARARGIPILLDSHPNSFGQKSSRVGRFFLPVHGVLVRRATATIVGTEELADRVRTWGGEAVVVQEAPPVEPFPPPRVAPNSRPKVLWIGVFAPDEPIAEVIEAARLAPEFDFLVTGDLRRCPIDPTSAPDNVEWLGFIYDDDYRDAVSRADVVLALTSDSTSALRAAAEAVYSHTPLVTSDLPHLAALFPGAVRVENSATDIATGVRAAIADFQRLTAVSAQLRRNQVARWEAQRAILRAHLELVPQARQPGRFGTR